MGRASVMTEEREHVLSMMVSREIYRPLAYFLFIIKEIIHVRLYEQICAITLGGRRNNASIATGNTRTLDL